MTKARRPRGERAPLHPSVGAPPEEAGIRIHAFDARARGALDALTAAYDAHAAALLIVPPPGVPLDVLAERTAGAAAFAGRARALARALLRYAIDPAPGTSAPLDAARTAVEDELRSLLGPRRARRASLSFAAPDAEVLAVIAELLREIGLEELDLSAHLGQNADGAPVIISQPAPAATAHVWLLGRLFERIELLAAMDPLLALEREASRWWFERWSGPRRHEVERFSHTVREQEWTFVDRDAIALDAPAATALCDQPFFAELPPRQQRLARALRQSFASLFVVRDTRPDAVTLENLVDGGEHVIHEHNQPVNYRPGFLALGRLIPFGGGRHLRSPGMLFLQPRGPSTGPLLADGLRRARSDMARAILVESVIATLVSGTRTPRMLKPAATRREARLRLQELADAMDAAGLRKATAPDDVPDDLRAASAKPTALYMYPVDEVVGGWAAALSAQSGTASRDSAARQPRGRPSRRTR